jgi:tetratricopeptide (TPR) repeat protein
MNTNDNMGASANNSNSQPSEYQLLLANEINTILSKKEAILSNDRMPESERLRRVDKIYREAETWLLSKSDDKKVYSTLLRAWGQTLDDFKAHEDAEQVYLKKVRVDEEFYGTEHAETANTYERLGTAYESMGNDHRALECYYKVLDIRMKIFGPNHIRTADAYNNIANVYYFDYEEMHETGKALEYLQKALAIYEATEGADEMAIDIIKDKIEDMKEQLEKESAKASEDSDSFWDNSDEETPKKKSLLQRLFGK